MARSFLLFSLVFLIYETNAGTVPFDRVDFPDVLNPDRGIYKHTETLASSPDPLDLSVLESWRDSEYISLVYRVFVLDTFTNKDISAAYLTEIGNDLTTIKSAYMKVVLRFCYSLEGSQDANQAQAVRHIQQLAPIFKQYAMIITVVQAGFIGQWGEWYYTDNMKTKSDRIAIINALIDAVPTDIMIQVRSPAYKQEKCGTTDLTPTTALTGEPCARIGIFNDCFLASGNDEGTFRDGSVAADQQYFVTNSLYTPAGGETCEVNSPRTDCMGAMAEIKKYHYTFLNKDWNDIVVKGWVDGGCYNTIKPMLGYRYRLSVGALPTKIVRGQAVTFKFSIANTGVASLFSSHPAEIILSSQTVVRNFTQTQMDARRWAAGVTYNLSATVTVPADFPTGSCDVLLNIYDLKRPTNKYNRIIVENPGLATSSRYNILGTTTVA